MTSRSLYTAELAERILGELRARRSLRSICRDEGMPCLDTVSEWIKQDRDGFAARYRQAREIGHGRPGRVDYTREIADRILEELMGSRTLISVCRDPGMPGHTTVCGWVATDRDGFAARYRAAREVGQLRQAQVAYSVAITDRILAALETGQILCDICAEPDMPSVSAVHGWRRENRDGFAARFEEARQTGCQAIAEDILKIVDGRDNDWILWHDEDGHLQRLLDPERNKRTEIQVRERWRLVSRMAPQRFGEPPKAAAGRPEDGGAYERDLAEMRALINGRSRGLPGEEEPLDDA
jgi:hypothetical protein